MRIDRYVSSLLPSFEKKRVVKDIEFIRDELKKNTLPPYREAAEFFKRRKFQAKHIEEFDKRFQKQVKPDQRGNFVVVTAASLEGMDERIDLIEKFIEKYYAKDVVVSGISYFKANVLQYLELCSFTLRYARKVLLWTYASETNAAENNRSELGKELTKGEERWMKENEENFFHGVRVLNKTTRDTQKSLEDIPDIVVNPDNTTTVSKTVGLSKLDPFQFNLINARLNPIYHIRMTIAEFQVSRYKEALEEKKQLEYKLLNLRSIDEQGERDPKLQQEIEYNESRLEKLRYRIHKMEEKYDE